MNRITQLDKYDWRGCDVVQHDAEKLSGRGTVEDTRMDADGILDNYEDGLSVVEIAESYGVELGAVEKILEFAAVKGMRATA